MRIDIDRSKNESNILFTRNDMKNDEVKKNLQL